MTPDLQMLLLFKRHPHNPNNTQQMVVMCMCDKYVVNVCQIYIGSLQLRENSVASATINQQQCLVYMECETSVVTMRGMSIARTKKADMVVVECFFCSLGQSLLLFITEPLAHKTVSFGMIHKVEMFQYGWRRFQIVIVHLLDGHFEIDHLVVRRVET